MAGKLTTTRYPKIGWWLDKDQVVFYHGTHKRHLDSILRGGIRAPTRGPAANWVSLALEPNTAHAYASMSGETAFRAAGQKAVHVPDDERVVLVVKMKKNQFLPKMAPERGAMSTTKGKLKDKTLYEKHVGHDVEYYSMTEIRYPVHVPAGSIMGWMSLAK